MELEQLEIQQYGMVQTSADAQSPDKLNDVDYVGSLDTWEVGKPIERTEAEVLQRLGGLGQTSSLIEEIYQNHSQYPKELLAALANNPEMADFVSGYPDRNGVTEGITASEKEQEFPLFLQWDRRWGYESYGDSCIGLAGCGPTCLSMVLFYLTRDETYTPDKIAAYSVENGYYVEGTGTSWVLMEDIAKLYGIKVNSISATANNMRAVLDNGGIIICAMGKGDFTLSGHYIVIYGYDNDGFMVNDPNCVARSGRRWTFSEIEKQIKSIWLYDK
ncbi:MAG: C39 family peptidase [Lachnospiraceae bacterium]|nr:C39 family peptidase [Lachnospiraceae bacterium]